MSKILKDHNVTDRNSNEVVQIIYNDQIREELKSDEKVSIGFVEESED